ncbi:MAG: TatD family hydrolase, partial [Spirochaetota bacterium]
RSRTVAVGEIGMDRYRDYATPELQRVLLIRQVEIANRHNLPVIIHNRDAEEELLQAFAECTPECESIMHCYSGPSGYVHRFLDLGFSFSFGGNVTFKNAQNIREAMMQVPLDRLMLETDAPYLAPHPRRGRTNHPGLIGHTYDAVSETRGISRRELVEAAADNAARVFGI